MIQFAIEHSVNHGDATDLPLRIKYYIEGCIHNFSAITPIKVLVLLIKVISLEISQISLLIVGILP